MIRKPYTGKPSVRFDEGELEIEPNGHYASSLLYYLSYAEEKEEKGYRVEMRK